MLDWLPMGLPRDTTATLAIFKWKLKIFFFCRNGGRNSYDPVEIVAKKLRKLNEANILVITILESQKIIVGSKLPIEIQINFTP